MLRSQFTVQGLALAIPVGISRSQYGLIWRLELLLARYLYSGAINEDIEGSFWSFFALLAVSIFFAVKLYVRTRRTISTPQFTTSFEHMECSKMRDWVWEMKIPSKSGVGQATDILCLSVSNSLFDLGAMWFCHDLNMATR